MKLIIGISKGSGSPKYANYAAWLAASGEDIEIVDLSVSSNVEHDAARIDALVLSGGSDINPTRYDHPEYANRCFDVDDPRDELELRLLEVADERDLPVLAICRGLQIVNVHRGGTLHPHLPDVDARSQMHQKDGERDSEHTVTVTPGSLLYKATGEVDGMVNSAHHQAIDRLGEGLMITARADDGCIEAVERLDHNGKPYLMAVQWHPERMADHESPFSRGLREQFLFEVHSARILAGVRRPLPRPEAPTDDEDGTEPANGVVLPIIQ